VFTSNLRSLTVEEACPVLHTLPCVLIHLRIWHSSITSLKARTTDLSKHAEYKWVQRSRGSTAHNVLCERRGCKTKERRENHGVVSDSHTLLKSVFCIYFACFTVCLRVIMQCNARYCKGIYVHQSDCLTVDCDKTKEMCAHIHSYTTWKNVHPSFLTRRMVGGGWPFRPDILEQTYPVFLNADLQSIFARSVLAVTPRKKVQLTQIGSPLSTFKWN